MINHTNATYDENGKLNCPDQSNRVWYVTKKRQDNDMIYCIGMVYDGNAIEQSGSIGSGVIFDENQIRQGCD